MSRAWPVRRRYRAGRPRGPRRRLFDYALTAILFGLLALVAARMDRLNTRREQGVVTVNDGDSLTLGATRIRLRGIDAPEYTQSCTRFGADYACGRMARQALVALIGGRPVTCDGWQKDRYGRLLGDCTAGGVNSTGRWWTPAGRWPMATSKARRRRLGQPGAVSGPAASSSRRNGGADTGSSLNPGTIRSAASSTA